MNKRKANLRKLRLPSSGNSDSRKDRVKATPTISNLFTLDTNDIELPNGLDATAYSEPMPSPIEFLNTFPPESSTIPLPIEVETTEMPSPIECLNSDLPQTITNNLPHAVKTEEYIEEMPLQMDKPEEEPETKPRRATRTKLSTFLPKQKRIKPTADKPISDFLTKGKSDDFESSGKNVRKAPKTKAKPRSKRQPKIKTAFFKNEEVFSAVTAQHCVADNINPEEMQMALALSRSEAYANGTIIMEDEENKDEKDGIRGKLKKFGFRVAETEDYNITAFKPTNKKTKWANKFTALTLRNPKRQLEKVSQKVEEFLSTQFISSESTHADQVGRYSVKSQALLRLVPGDHIVIRPDSSERICTVEFYVLSLFEPSRTKPGHLLKNVHRIPGRDRSPVKARSVVKEQDSMLKSPAIKKSRYDENVFHVGLSLPCPVTDQSSAEELNHAIQTLPATISVFSNYDPVTATSPREITSHIDDNSLPTTSSGNNPFSNSDCDDIESRLELSCNVFNEASSMLLIVTQETSTTSKSDTTPKTCMSIEGPSQLQLSSIRATSPDIFADSDIEMETEDCCEMEKLNVSMSSSSGNHLTTYEIFSSDEAKTFSGTKDETNDVNHNSLTAVIDLTQCDSAPNSQHSDKIVPSTYIQSYQEKCDPDDLPMLSLKSEEIAFTSFRLSTECPFPLNRSCSFERSTESKRACFSFDSSGSDDLHTSTSFKNKTEDSIDLTQRSDNDAECILLSDDEVNYSIRNADRSIHVKGGEDLVNQTVTTEDLLFGDKSNKSEEKHDFSFVDLVTGTQPLPSQSGDFDFDLKTKSNTSLDSYDLDLMKRSDFGILEDKSPFKTPTKTPKKTPRKTPTSASTKCRRALSESFLGAPVATSASLMRSASAKKFYELTQSETDDDLDDIDKLIFGSPSKKAYKKPAGLDQLLTGDISAMVNSPKKGEPESPKEFEFNSRTYLVRTKNVLQKPDFVTMDELQLLNQLYKYGIRPLKRKQAVKILEYVYNQTHPCLVDEADIPSQTVTTNDQDYNALDDGNEMRDTAAISFSKSNFKDCWGHVIVSDIEPSMEIENEQYIFQTNTSKKILTAKLPFHIAWHNLVKSNKQLHEAILHYEPIDLQEIYLFFKSLGYRYDPKELKYFFDSRSIIFRYDLNKSDHAAGASRHVRKKRLKFTQKNGKNKIS